jgi:ER-bound oxygenase mpaB/B'/Rubber oxygenase, catalytic domain
MKPSVNPMLLSDEEWEKYRYESDEYADYAAFHLLLNIKDPSVLYGTMGKIQKNNDEINLDGFNLEFEDDVSSEGREFLIKEAKKTLTEYFKNDDLFQFTDEEKLILKKASEFFCVHMTEATLALALRSLLKQYSAFKSTNVLVFTKLLPKYPHRRIITTMQFVMDVMDINAWENDGYAKNSIKKLRLMHAMIRYRINTARIIEKQKGGIGRNKKNWDDEKKQWGIFDTIHWQDEWGEPINQQDMIFAVHTFSIEVLKGIMASGEPLPQNVIDIYYKAWHLIGRALGVRDEINPSDYNIGVQLQERIYAKEFTGNNPNAPILAEPLIDFLDQSLPGATRNGILGLVKLFNDEKDYVPIFKNILKIDLDQATDFYSKIYSIADRFGHTLMDTLYKFKPAADQPKFFYDMAQKQHKLFEMAVSAEKTWDSDHFRIADGFGDKEAIFDEEKAKELPPMWKRLLLKFLPSVAKFIGIKNPEITIK